MTDSPFRPQLCWQRSWPDQRQMGTGWDPRNPKCQLKISKGYTYAGGGLDWHWIANEKILIAQGYTATVLEAIAEAEKHYFDYINKQD